MRQEEQTEIPMIARISPTLDSSLLPHTMPSCPSEVPLSAPPAVGLDSRFGIVVLLY